MVRSNNTLIYIMAKFKFSYTLNTLSIVQENQLLTQINAD